MDEKNFLDKKAEPRDNFPPQGGGAMSEEQFLAYMERLEQRGQELENNPELAKEVLESAGICDSDGDLTDLYK